MTVLLVIASDLHCGSTVGLCPPAVDLDDGGTYRASKAQRWLWSRWDDTWRRLEERRAALGADPWVVLNGDLVDGDHHGTYQLITRNPSTMQRIAIQLLEPVRQWAREFFIVRGTPSHVGEQGHLEEGIAQDLAANPSPEGTASWWHLRLEAESVGFDIAHHGNVGRLRHTKPNWANRLAVETFYDYSVRREKPPAYVVRAHMHQAATSDPYSCPVRAVQLPGWQLATGYVNQRNPGALGDIGLAVFECSNGAHSMDIIRHNPLRGKPWRGK